ncbi:MAG: acetyl-CoA hydrolase/transferase [Cyanobacteria bacterium RYN_339]|nr:acetyl-CoA hydrolase/transferase [Cyanobacteria bacterium RYN_339]
MTLSWQQRAVSPAEAVGVVQSGHHVFLHGACATSHVLERALAERAAHLRDVTAYQLHKAGPEPLVAPELEGHVRVVAMFCGPAVRQAVAEGRADYVPVFLSDIPHLFRARTWPLDVAIVQLSPPDVHGYCSLGTSVDVARSAVDTATHVIAEINHQMPRTLGAGMIHISELDAYTVTDRPLPEEPARELDEVSRAIGQHVADLVPDGATLQLGIGAIPAAVCAALHGKHDLRLYTEMFSDAVVDLMEAGAFSRRHEAVTSFVSGTRRLYDFVHNNPMVLFQPSDVTNDTAEIRRHSRMTAINCALEVDLTGQVCADSIGHRVYSGIGGQMDFIRGAALAPGGKAIIALPSTALGGRVSRIVPELAPGAGVVTTRGHVQFVVTEYGVADLRGRSLRERALLLAEIAHPDHRIALRHVATGRRAFVKG